MKEHDNKAYIKWGLTIFITAAAVILFYYFIFHISQVVTLFKSFLQIIAPILTGIVMAYLITPIINFLEKKIYGTFFKNKTITPKVKKRVRVVTIIISILLILFLIYEFFAMIIPELRSSIENISAQLLMHHRHVVKPVCANVDFYSGFVYTMLGIPRELFTPLFAISRIAGWSAHRLEELVNRGKIIRPAYKYVGHHSDFKDIDKR